MDKDKKNNKGIIILVAFIIAVLLLVLVYFLFINNPKDAELINKPEETKEISKIKGLTEENVKDYANEYIEYYNKEGTEFCFYDDITRCSTKKISIKTESEVITKYNEYKDKYVFYKDNGKLKVYDNYAKKSYVINVDSRFFSYEFHTDDLTDEFVGITYYVNDEDYASYYSVINDRVIYNKKYKEMHFLSSDYVTGNEFECSKGSCRQSKTNLLSAKEDKVLLSYTFKKKEGGYYEDNLYYELLRNDKQTYICLSTFIDATIYKEIYNTDYKKLKEDIGEYSASVSSEGYLYIEKNGVVTAYNKDGEETKKSEKYNILQIIDDYIVTIKNNKLSLVTIDGDTIEIASWNKNKNAYMVHYSKSIKEKGIQKIILAVLDTDVKIDDVWITCEKNGNCYASSKEELGEYYDMGYFYYFIKDTKEITKVPVPLQV